MGIEEWIKVFNSKTGFWNFVCGRPYPEDAPASLRAITKAFSQTDLIEAWEVFFDPENHLDSEILYLTETTLEQYGFRNEVIDWFIVFLIAECINVATNKVFSFKGTNNDLLLKVAELLLSGALGDPDLSVVEWLLDFGIEVDNDDAMSLKSILLSALSGNKASKINLVSKISSYWHVLLENDDSDSWEQQTDQLGIIYKFLEELDDKPEALALRANLLYRNGRAGDEETARQLAVKSALLGCCNAWDLLEEWIGNGDQDVIKELIITGRAFTTRKAVKI